MATNKETSVEIRADPDLLAEIQKMRADLITATEEIKKNQKDSIQELESKIVDIKKENKKNLDKITEKLQSIESLVPKISKSNEESGKSKNDSTGSKNVTLLKTTTSVASEKRIKLKHVFKNINKLREIGLDFSEVEDHFNVNWRLAVQRHNNHLGFFVCCEPIAPKGKWSIRTKYECKVVGKDLNDVIKRGETCYKKKKGLGLPDFLEWEKMGKEYLVDGRLTVEIDLTIIEMVGFEKRKIRKFDESQKDVSDVILVVRDTKFYAAKMFLAAQSSLFKALLFGNFKVSKQSEVTLNGIDPNDFHYFLEVLYGESAIDDSNVEDIALLADMYDAPTAIRKCEEFLLEKSKKTLKKKLEIATRYHLKNV
ncbi:unnamed protein product [Caenorhabditis nigoni]